MTRLSKLWLSFIVGVRHRVPRRRHHAWGSQPRSEPAIPGAGRVGLVFGTVAPPLVHPVELGGGEFCCGGGRFSSNATTADPTSVNLDTPRLTKYSSEVPKAHPVRLPHNVPVHFPGRCVVCQSESPDSQVRFSTPAGTGFVEALKAMLRRGPAVHVPACGPCARKVVLERFGDFALICALGLPFVIFVYRPHIEAHMPYVLSEAGLLLAMFLPALPYALWKKNHPPHVDVQGWPDRIEFLFRNEAYADAFADANEDEFLPLG